MTPINKPTKVSPKANLGEKEMLSGWLDFFRATLLNQCAGLSDDQLRQRAVPPSTLSLMGILRHMADVENWWFSTATDGNEPCKLFARDGDEDFDEVHTHSGDDVAAAFLVSCDESRAVVAHHDLDDLIAFKSERRPEGINVRWVVTHMIEEYARHCGHADLLRQVIDGATAL